MGTSEEMTEFVRGEAALAAARAALPEPLRELLHESADGNYACGEWGGQEAEESYDTVYQRALAIDIRLAQAIAAALAQGEKAEGYRAALERIAALPPWSIEPRGCLYTAVGIAEEALKAADPARPSLSTARAGEVSHG